MCKHHSDHLSLFHVIVKKSIEMLLFCNHCSFLNKQCFVFNKSEKCSEYVKLKHLCFFSCSVYATDVSHLLHTHEKLNHDKKSVLKKCQRFNAHLVKLNEKILHLKHHQHFLKECDDKLIQENAKVFEEELHVLKKKQDFITSLNDNSFNSLIFRTNTDTVFSTLSDNF